MHPPTLRLSLLGGFELRCGSDPIRIRSGRMRALLAWLALHADAPGTRRRVASALWPDSREGQARTNLRNLIHRLRGVFPEIELYLETEGEVMGWRPGAPLSVDVAEFERSLAEARAGSEGSAGTIELAEALDGYAGPLLPEHDEPWLDAERARLERAYLDGLAELLERHRAGGDPGAVRVASERILRHDPSNELAHRARIRALAALGDRAAAARAFEECETVLARELGVAPDEATREAYREALNAGGAPDADRPRDRDGRDPANEADGRAGPDAPAGHAGASAREGARPEGEGRLVGRVREHAALVRAWSRVRESASGTVWVTGEAGIGKTRLVQSFVEWLEDRGERVPQARAYATLGALAYGPVIAWFRSPALAAALAAAPSPVRSELRRLLPELGPHTPDPGGERSTESERRQRLHDAVLAVLASDAAPSVLILDDLQWSDRETVDLLSALVLRSARPLLIVATLRTGEVGPEHGLVSTEARLRAAGRLEHLELSPLDVDETGALARDLAGAEISDDDVRALHDETEGNPLFIVETVRSGRPWAGGEEVRRGDPDLSPRIRAVIEARLALLSPEARQITRIAATIGREFTVPLLLRVSPLDEEATLRGLDDAWRRMLVRERAGGFDFSHGKIREVAYRTTSPIRRRAHHLRLAEVMAEGWGEGSALPEATLDQVALHYDLGGSVANAIEWYRRAARAAMEVSGLDAVRQLLGRALDLLQRLPPQSSRDEQELDMRLGYGSVLVALEGYGRARTMETYDRARALCERLERPVTSPILRALALASLSGGDLDAGVRYGQELSRAAERDGDEVARVEGAYVSGVMAFWRGALRESQAHLTAALEAYRPERRREHVLLYAQDPRVVCLSRLAWTLWHRGRITDAHARRDEALAAAEREDDPLGLAYALWFTLFIPVDQGDTERIAAQTRRMRRIADAHRLPYIGAVEESFAGYLQALAGEARAGLARMRAVADDPRWLGMEYLLKLQTLYLIARAAVIAGDGRTARDTVREALEYIGPGPSFWKAPFARIEAHLAGLEDRRGDEAPAAFRHALEIARRCGSSWIELGVAVDRARWCLARRGADRGGARADLERALIPYATAPPLPALAAARILMERLTEEDIP